MNYSKRLFKILIIFEPISIVINIFVYYENGIKPLGIITYTVRDIIFYPKGALWFIQACIVGVWIIYYMIKYKKTNLLIPISVVCYVFALICNSYYFLVEGTSFGNIISNIVNITYSVRNGIFVGVPYLYLGMMISKIHNLRKLSKISLAILMIISGIIYYIELCLVRNAHMMDDGSLFIMLPVFISFLLLFVLNYSSDNNKLILTMRNLSTGMYILHSPLNLLFYYGMIVVFDYHALGIIRFFFTLLSSLIMCIISYNSKNSKINGILR